jgi:hypothetical protein
VAPSDAERVVIGWINAWFSEDGGSTWDRRSSDDDPHVHDDVHAVIFDAADPGGRTVFVGSDGGVAVTRDLGASFTSEFNPHLLTLQFEALGREFYGLMSASAGVPGLVGGGLQDNGVVYAHLGSGDDAWRQIIGGDGNLMLFVATGHTLYYNGDIDTLSDRFVARKWNGTELADDFVVPIRRFGPEPIATSTGLPQGLCQLSRH